MRVKNIKNTEIKKEEIMHQAFKLMAKKGIVGISMREIAQNCGVTKPVLYYYFKDKEELCYEMIKTRIETSSKMLKDYAESETSFEKIIIFIFSKYMCSFRVKKKDQSDFVLNLHSYAASNPHFYKRLKKFEGTGLRIFGDILDRECEKGTISPKVKLLGVHLILANVAHLALRHDFKKLQIYPGYEKDMARMILRALDYKGETIK